mgnify:CR=1 FL=1
MTINFSNLLGNIQQGDSASRPGSPIVGLLYYNTELNYFESYTSNGWFPIAAPPTPPTSIVATNSGSGRTYDNGSASVAFTLPTTGGSPTSFIVRPTPSTSPATFTGSSSPIIATNLLSNTGYTYTVVSSSPYGNSSDSTASSSVTATTKPQAPTIGAATAGNASATVAYTAGATGGSAITTFTATSSPGGLTGTGSSPITVSGLTNGTAYTFTVTATNSNGTSSASAASNSVTPFALTVTGGTLTSDATYNYRTFTSTSNLVVSGASLSCDILVVAGGGSGGGGGGAGGGGAGGLVYLPSQLLTAQSYTCTVGGGGPVTSGAKVNGVNSQFGSLTSAIGGGGGGYDNPSSGIPGALDNGNSGGSGGGSSSGSVGSGNTPPVSPPQGNNGGAKTSGSAGAGGGGGATAVGASGTSCRGGAGGNGLDVTAIFGSTPQPEVITGFGGKLAPPPAFQPER